MKKILSLSALVLALGAMPMLSQADEVGTGATPLGSAAARTNADGSVELYADGAPENAATDPSGELDGYAGVVIGADGSASVFCNGENSWDDPDGDDLEDGTDPDGVEA